MSAISGAGLSGLLTWVGPLIKRLTAPEGRAPVAEEPAERASGMTISEGTEGRRHVTYRPLPTGAKSFVVRREPAGLVVRGRAVRRLVSRFDLDNEEAIQYLAGRLDRLGVSAALKAHGAQPGDEVDLEGYTFEFQ